VTFRQDGSCLRGTLNDPGIPNGPTSGPIYGTVNGDQVTFSFTYTYTGATQGTRTYAGIISRSGAVSGNWTETGTEASNTGSWTLGAKASLACPRYVLRRQPWRECPVRS